MSEGKSVTKSESKTAPTLVTDWGERYIASLTLSEEAGDFYLFKGKPIFTFDFLLKAAQITGLSIITPQTAYLDGQPVDNGYKVINEDTNKYEIFISRKIAFGLSPSGQWTAVDQTVIFNPRNYMKSMLANMAKNYPKIVSYRTLGSLNDNERKNGYFVKVDGDGDNAVGLFAPDPNHKEMAKLWEKYLQLMQFADRRAASMAERNAIRKHPAVARRKVEKTWMENGDKLANLNLYSWKLNGDGSKSKMTMESRLQMGERIESADFTVITHEDPYEEEGEEKE